MIRPIRSRTRPWRRCRSASRSAAVAVSVGGGDHAGVAPVSTPSALCDDLAGALELGLDARVDVAVLGAHDRAAAADAALGLDLAVLDAAERGAQLVHRLAHELEVLRVDEHGHALALDEAAQRAAHGLDDALGLDGERAADDLLGEEQRRARRRGPRAGRPRRSRSSRAAATASASASSAGLSAASASARPAS